MQTSLPPQSFRPAATNTRSSNGFEHQEKVLELLANATGVLAGGVEYKRAIHCLASILVKDFATWCTIDLLQEDGQIERVAAAHRNPEKIDLVKRMQTHYPPDPKASNGVYRAINTRTSILLPHISREQWAKRAQSPEHFELIMSLGSTSFIVVPLIARNEPVGAIMLLADDRVFSQDDVDAAEHYAAWIAMVVDNILMFKKMKSTMTELERTQNKLIQSTKMAAIGVMSAGLAHEINNPLAIIRLSCEKVRSLLPNTSDQIENYFSRMEYGIERIVRIINSVSDFSRITGPSLVPVDLNEILEKSVELIRSHQNVSVTRVELESHHSSIITNGSDHRLQQLFVNVLTNALDAITLKQIHGHIRVKIWKDQSHARVVIEDNGVGIPTEIQDRIFEPFFTTKGSRGSGLGLAVSHGIVEDHSGTIRVDSKVNEGTRVTIEIPLLLP